MGFGLVILGLGKGWAGKGVGFLVCLFNIKGPDGLWYLRPKDQKCIF